MDKEDVVCIYIYIPYTYIHPYTMEYYSAIRKNEYPPFASSWMELEGIMLSEISQSEVNHHVFTHMWNIRNSERDYEGKEGN